jgi:GMP synthase (glutamine-hydrolysing)
MKRLTRLRIVDAVEWSADYPAAHPLRDVGEWFARHLREMPAVTVTTGRGDEELMRAVRERTVDGVILSGSPRDAWAADPVNDRLAAVILECQRREVPFLGVCYGHQLLGRVLGGRVGREPAGLELGNAPVELTEAGRQSPLFAGLPDRFEVLQSHQDAVLSLPPGAELLARGTHTVVQAFQQGERLWGVQFHPEQDPAVVRFVWEPRRATWRERVAFDLDARLAGLRPTPWAARVLRNFASVCGREAR